MFLRIIFGILIFWLVRLLMHTIPYLFQISDSGKVRDTPESLSKRERKVDLTDVEIEDAEFKDVKD